MLKSLAEEYPERVVSLNDFEIGKVIGHGGFSEVYFGLQKSTGIYVAIKILKQRKLTEERFVVYEREIKILAQTQNRFILGFVGFTITYPYSIITIYTSGNSLYNALHHVGDAPVLTGTQKSKIAFAIAIGMKKLHNMRVIHRDLKSLNVLLDRQLYPKICDFGLSRFVMSEESLLTVNIGTPHWMAPELFENSMYTNKVDVYSYAMVLWELLVGSYPFKGVPAVQIAFLVCKKQERPKLPSRTPNSLAKLITKCWAQKTEDRPSFGHVYKEFMENQVHYPDTDMNELNRFMRECIDNIDVPYDELEFIRKLPKRNSIPTEMKSSQPFHPVTDSDDDFDLSSLSSAKSSDFLKALASVKKDMQPFHALQFFNTLKGNILEKPDDEVLLEIVTTIKDLISDSLIALTAFIESGLFNTLPLDKTILSEQMLEIYLQVFSITPKAVSKIYLDHLAPLSATYPQKVLCIMHRYLCGHYRNQFFLEMSDYLISSYQTFLNTDSSKEYLNLLFTLIQLNEDFKYSRYLYIQSILLETIRLNKHPEIATDMIIYILDPNSQLNQELLIPILQQKETAEYGLSILARLNDIVPPLPMLNAVIESAKKYEIGSLILCKMAENEVISSKLADEIGEWASLNLPNLFGTFRLYVVVLHNKRNVRILSTNESSLELLKRIVVLKDPKLISNLSHIFSCLNSAMFINSATEYELLGSYFRICLELGDSSTIAACLFTAERLARTSWSEEYLQIIPLSAALLKQMGGWEKFVLPFIATVSCYEDAADEIYEYNVIDTLNLLLSSQELGAYAQAAINNLQ
ncbi:TKL family protein kinase [Trichomonas vaginalis G3]|uniref:TKL family protein kinase n=1 Tax=Trichomonas vaginalis (strain ATCC PRA-98 / G3) TaxID=412133 RepID=A2FKB9_TRIV3|nr:protein kinase protein [Trichomonas vaginalis G3]EAX94659.1 TKL family protein kinase [Trichomonas vaginalis G3]KAI5503806.1 protein kinase protein [Trichomonas vaginalis G3]|eukprot:XP_001307589.1 TKL family protein kinase [Trichomonas vaginalis G3]